MSLGQDYPAGVGVEAKVGGCGGAHNRAIKLGVNWKIRALHIQPSDVAQYEFNAKFYIKAKMNYK